MDLLGHSRSLFPDLGRLLKCPGHLQYAKVVVVSTDDLNSDRETFRSEPARD